MLVHDRYRVGERDLNRLARFLGHSLDQILGGLVRVGQGQLVDRLAVIIARTFSSSAVVNDMILYIKMLDNYTFRIRLPDKNLITLPALRMTGAVTSMTIVWDNEVLCDGITWIVAVPVLRTVKFPRGSTYNASPE